MTQRDEHGLARRRLLGFDPGEVEQVVDDPAHPERLGMDARCEAAGYGLVALGHERLGEESERTHRGLELVAHVRDEVPADLLEAPCVRRRRL